MTYFEEACINYNEEGYINLPINDYFHHANNEDLYEVKILSHNNINLRDATHNLSKNDNVNCTEELDIIACCYGECPREDLYTFQGKKEDLEKILTDLKLYDSGEEDSYILVNFKYLVDDPKIIGNTHSVKFSSCNT